MLIIRPETLIRWHRAGFSQLLALEVSLPGRPAADRHGVAGADVARARRRWIRAQGWLDTTRLVFIDETAVTTNMVRLNGWNPCGERLITDAPMGHWETVTFIAGLRQTGIVVSIGIQKGPRIGIQKGPRFPTVGTLALAPLEIEPASNPTAFL